MSLANLISTGSKVWLDGIDPDHIKQQRAWGVTGATSNPAIISDLIKSGRFDAEMGQLISKGLSDEQIAWRLTDQLVCRAQEVMLPVWEDTHGDDGYVSFELDPLLEGPGAPPPAERKKRYVDLAQQWSAGHRNRMIKVPATEAGLASLEEVAAAGVTVNVTLIFTPRQYQAARDAVWRGAQRRPGGLAGFKSVYSIFISRIDVYTHKHLPTLTPQSQGLAGIVNAKRVWLDNGEFWSTRPTPLKQEIVFASTGAKLEGDSPDKYLEALAGDGILTNPPQTNQAVQEMEKPYRRTVDRMPARLVLDELDAKLDMNRMEQVLMAEGVEKFATPQQALLKQIAQRRGELAGRRVA